MPLTLSQLEHHLFKAGFPKVKGLRLWVLPFCLSTRRIAIPNGAPFVAAFTNGSL